MIDYAKVNETRREASARAICLLTVLVDYKHLPAHHIQVAKEILAQWDNAERDAEAA